MYGPEFIDRLLKRWGSLAAEARDFAITHAFGGLVGVAGAAVWAIFGDPHTALELGVLVWLASPLGLAALAFSTLPMQVLQAISTLNAVAVLAGLAALSGGIHSIFLPWLVLVPAEAALSRRPLALSLAMVASAAAVVLLEMYSTELPAFTMALQFSNVLMSASLIGCVLYSGALALNVRAVHAGAARALAHSEASYRFLADNAADLILRLTANGRVLYASPAALTLIGQRPNSLVNADLAALICGDDLAKVQRAVTRAGYFGEELAIDCRARGNGDKPVWIELKCRPVHRAGAGARASWRNLWRKPKPAVQGMEIIAIARDVTARHRYEEELKRAIELAQAHSRAKSQFLANMSHELRTPLNSVIGFSEMISREMFGPLGHERYREYAGLIGESGQYLLNLINDILDVAKIEAGKLKLTREPVNLAQTLERTLLVMMPQFREKGVELTVNAAPDIPVISADARAMRQILFNLLSNALKFTPAGGRTRVRLACERERLSLEVADTGIGISESDLKRLARPFEQVSNAYVRAQAGTGLGLSLVKSLAVLHGGELSISSAVGKGTRVSVYLPISNGDVQIQPSSAAA